jgi:hypothetical protein
MQPNVNLSTNLNPLKDLVDAIMAKERARSRVQIGPGRRTVDTHHRAIQKSKYSGKDLRRIRAERGVGRPPRAHTTQADIDRALLALTDNQRSHLASLFGDYDGDLVDYKVTTGMKGNVWKKFLTKLDRLALIDSGNADVPRLTSLGRACGRALNDSE